MPDWTFKLEGFAELERQLLTLGARVTKHGLRSANFGGAKVVREATKQRVRSNGLVDTGTLEEAISVFRRRAPEAVVMHAIGVRRLADRADNPIRYGRMLEFGTSRMRPRPFLRPAFESTLDLQVRTIGNKLKAVVEREAKKRT